MSAEAQTVALPYETSTHQETVYDADSFCDAYKDVIGLVRHGLSAAEARFNFDRSDLKKAETIIYSDQLHNYLERAVTNGNYPHVLADEQMRSLIIDMACTGAFGSIVKKQLDGDKLGPARVFKERVVEMNHAFVSLADSELGRQLGLGRSSLRNLIGTTLGMHPSSNTVIALEKGIAVEVGTKNCLTELGAEYGIDTRWSSAQEDLHNIDIVCTQGGKQLDIQVKSVDSVGRTTGDSQQALYSGIEEYGLHEYRVRQLSPAADTAIGEDFEVRAPRYRQKLEELLTEFDKLE
jgi:hypothetical protein